MNDVADVKAMRDLKRIRQSRRRCPIAFGEKAVNTHYRRSSTKMWKEKTCKRLSMNDSAG